MKTKFALLAATVIAGISSSAQAQFAFPTVELRGVGASAPADVNAKVQACLGDDNNAGVISGPNTLLTNNSGANVSYSIVDYIGGVPNLNCTDQNPLFQNSNVNNSVDYLLAPAATGYYMGKYVSTGSGFGRRQWRNFTSVFTGLTGSINANGNWPNVQYALSEAPATPGDITDYNTDDAEVVAVAASVDPSLSKDIDVSAAANAGAPIQFPLYVIPVAFAYNPQYGTKAGSPLLFNNQFPQQSNAINAGGIRMKKATYCGIWNGTITNWNDPALKALNNNISLGDATDVARFDSEGVPIRLVGRADNSGTTDIFTRALAAQCSGTKFTKAAEALPFAAGNIDITKLRTDSPYNPAATGVYAGTVQSLSGLVYDRTNNRFCIATNDASNETTAGVCSATPAARTFADFATGAFKGLFTVADGSSGVEAAVRLNTGVNAAITSVADPSVELNGKLGYVGADFVAGSTGRTLFAAALQEGTSNTIYRMPNSDSGTDAFGKVLPPQTLTNGKYTNAPDTRTIYNDLTNTAGGGTTNPVRTNPLHWVNVLYPVTGATLANPAKGYAVTGASNLLTYTCFTDEGKRSGISNMVLHLFGNVKKKSVAGNGTINLDDETFKGIVAAKLGVLTKSNIGLPAKAWQTAISQTFFGNAALLSGSNAQPALGALNLWIQSKQVIKAADYAAVVSNPSCGFDNGGTGGTIPGA